MPTSNERKMLSSNEALKELIIYMMNVSSYRSRVYRQGYNIIIVFVHIYRGTFEANVGFLHHFSVHNSTMVSENLHRLMANLSQKCIK